MTGIHRTSAMFIVALLVAAMVPTSAPANGTVGNFEVDGNSADESGAGDPIDWATPPPALTPFTDLVKSNKDDAFGQGSKELEPSGWMCVKGGVPPKDDIVRGAIAFRSVDGKQYGYANWVRASTNGDAHVDYEFNQSNAAGPCPGVPKRTDGDLLITFDTENGGKTILVRAFSWLFTGPGIGVFNQLPGTAEHLTFDAAANIPPSLSDPGLGAGAFGELSLNLTDTIGTISCGEFAGVYMKTRASSEINSALKDRTLSKPLNIAKCEPNLSITKSADTSTVAQGGSIIYTISYSNTGTGPADQATITDTVPSGTSITGCTGGCTTSGSTATWQVGPVPAGVGGSVTLTVRVDTVPASCQICNTASISSPQLNSGAPVVSSPACVTITPTGNAGGAAASGSANGLVIAAGTPIDGTTGTSSSSQSGPGSLSDADVFQPVDASPVATAGIIMTSSSSSVSAAEGANQTSSAETANVNVSSGVVTASAVRAAASTTATGSSSSISSEGSWIKDLVVDIDGSGPTPPEGLNNVQPNTTIDLSAAFGSGSYVKIYERIGSTDGPDPGELSGATYAADLTVNMIHVFLADMDSLLPGTQSAEVIVSQAIAHSDFPQTQLCVPGPVQSVSGNASILEETTSPLLLPIVVGFVEIPASGGVSHQHLDAVVVEGVATAAGADSDSSGTTDSDSSDATSYAEAGRVCLLPSGGTCVVSATALRSQAGSSASAGGATSSDAGTVFVDLQILGTPVGDTPAPNTEFLIPGVGIITLNRQFCDDGGTPDDCSGASSTGLTVQAIHILVNDPMLPIGSEIVVAEAHSDALFVA